METFSTILQLAFEPGDGSVFLITSMFFGLATGRLSYLWLAVLLAAGVDVLTPGVLQIVDGYSLQQAKIEIISRTSESGGIGILIRTIGYFASISVIVLLKKGLGTE